MSAPAEIIAKRQLEIAEGIASDLARLVGELNELSDEAGDAQLHRAQARFDRAVVTLTSTLHGLNSQVGKLRGHVRSLSA